ncbi:hypothetical protein AB431_28770 [Mycobacterium sp. EPa45]|nr:hypothetical protein AB431_28770 [Mycobacterium sp. EPa45]
MLEERWAGDTAVVGAHDAGAGGGRELLGVAIPRQPAAGIRVDQHDGVGGIDRRIVGTDRKRVEPVHSQQPGLERQRLQVVLLHPADRQIEAAVGDPRGLRVRRHDPGVHPQLRDPGRPLGPIRRTPIDIADPDRLRTTEIRSAPSQFVSLGDQRPRVR